MKTGFREFSAKAVKFEKNNFILGLCHFAAVVTVFLISNIIIAHNSTSAVYNNVFPQQPWCDNNNNNNYNNQCFFSAGTCSGKYFAIKCSNEIYL